MAKNPDPKTELANAARDADVGGGEVPALPFQPQRVGAPKPPPPSAPSAPSKKEAASDDALRDELRQLEREHDKLSLAARVKELRAKVRELKHGKRSDETVSQYDKREKLRASTIVTSDRDGKKFAHYVVGAVKSYVHGVMLEPGSKVTVPYDELPSHTWKAMKPAVAKQVFEAAD